MVVSIHQQVAALAGTGVEVWQADPPWNFKSNSIAAPGRNPRRHYATMSLADIQALPVKAASAKNAVLFMWITTPFLVIGAHIPIFKAWGFEPTAFGLTWVKAKKGHPWHFKVSDADLHFGQGHTTRKNTEILLIGKRGRSLRQDASIPEVVIWPVLDHSRKPDIFTRKVEQYVGPGRRMVELFARRSRPGWITLGNESSKFDEAVQ